MSNYFISHPFQCTADSSEIKVFNPLIQAWFTLNTARGILDGFEAIIEVGGAGSWMEEIGDAKTDKGKIVPAVQLHSLQFDKQAKRYYEVVIDRPEAGGEMKVCISPTNVDVWNVQMQRWYKEMEKEKKENSIGENLISEVLLPVEARKRLGLSEEDFPLLNKGERLLEADGMFYIENKAGKRLVTSFTPNGDSLDI